MSMAAVCRGDDCKCQITNDREHLFNRRKDGKGVERLLCDSCDHPIGLHPAPTPSVPSSSSSSSSPSSSSSSIDWSTRLLAPIIQPDLLSFSVIVSRNTNLPIDRQRPISKERIRELAREVGVTGWIRKITKRSDGGIHQMKVQGPFEAIQLLLHAIQQRRWTVSDITPVPTRDRVFFRIRKTPVDLIEDPNSSGAKQPGISSSESDAKTPSTPRIPPSK